MAAMAAASEATSPGSASKPVSPTMDGTSDTRVATTGLRMAIASMTAFGAPSTSEDRTR